MRPSHREVDPGARDAFVSVRMGWSGFVAFLKARGDAAGPRVAYQDGVLELVAPSRHHEAIKRTLAHLIGYWSIESQAGLRACGAWTLKSSRLRKAVEPDDCYVVGPRGRRLSPDIVVEVKWTGGGVEKLDIYQTLGIPEVWLWEKGALTPYVLRRGRYAKSRRSALVPDLDFALLSRFSMREDQDAAAREFLAAARRH
jgi:Uma2 family endonuclease